MAVTVAKRPLGFITSASPVSVLIENVTSVFPGDAAFTKTAHGLSTGDYIYVTSTVDSYNGFWYVSKVDADRFYIREYVTADRVPFVKSVTASYVVWNRSHNWNCIHLPIVYKLSSDLWPTNSADTVRTISSVTDSNDYCAIVASADIKATGSAAALEFVKITGATDDDLNGVWQIIAYTNDTTFTVDIPYSSANDTALTGASIQYYYNNYHIKVQVWGGLDNGHVYYAQEPYELLATLSLIPDSDGICQFSIHEILKKNVAIKNNLLLGTLPNNLDAFTKFFIKYCEVYDDSDGTTLSTLAESYTSDMTSFEGIAVNAKLPFKSVHSGALTQYITEDSSQKFLTPFTRPTVFESQYFDLSLLWEGVQDIFYRFQWYLNSVLQTTTYSDFFDGFYTGVYRGEVEADCDYDRVDVTSYKAVGLPKPSGWADAGASVFDSKTSTTFVEALTSTDSAVSADTPFVVSSGAIVIISYTVVVSGTWTGGAIPIFVSFSLKDSGGNSVSTGSLSVGDKTISANGTYTYTEVLTATGTSEDLNLDLVEQINTGTADVVITPALFAKVIDSNHVISETKTLDIDCDCVRSKATGYYLAWLNYLGGFDYWYFTGYADHVIDITDSGETEENVFPEWPNSYGEFADTVRKQTFRKSRTQIVVRSQNLTLAQVQAIKNIKTSPLVQIVNSIYDRRTVLVDSESFTEYREGQTEQYTISFTITYTDDVPSQTV